MWCVFYTHRTPPLGLAAFQTPNSTMWPVLLYWARQTEKDGGVPLTARAVVGEESRYPFRELKSHILPSVATVENVISLLFACTAPMNTLMCLVWAQRKGIVLGVSLALNGAVELGSSIQGRKSLPGLSFELYHLQL